MKIIADTNVLLRAVLGDDEEQARIARRALRSAEKVIFTRHALCELIWVLRSSYGVSRANITSTIRTLCEADNAVVDTLAYDAGMAVLEGGGDFADGVIAYEGAWLGGETFVSFDKKAVSLIAGQGLEAKLLA